MHASQPQPRMSSQELSALVLDALDEMKAKAVKAMDVGHLTTVTEVMIIATGRSARHVRAVAETVIERCKQAGEPPLGREGEGSGEWVLLDLGDVVVHVMQPEVRKFYDLEKLWDIPAREKARV